MGFKSGSDFDSYIQACNIGLSTQQADAKFSATSFPSKILMYMSNGIRVVSIRIPAVEESDVGDYIYYYDNQNPKEIADVIKSMNFDDAYDSRKILDKLHTNFIEQLKYLLLGRKYESKNRSYAFIRVYDIRGFINPIVNATYHKFLR